MGVSIPENPERVQTDNEKENPRCSSEVKYIQKVDGLEEGLISELGGKAFNLNILASIGVNVPPCFTIKTNAYRVFTQQPELGSAIEGFIEESLSLDLKDLQSRTKSLRELFNTLPVPEEVVDEITAAYSELTGKKLGSGVSVRSSATSEDLAEASFAGLHNTYLGVSGTEEVLSAVRGCWASLWSAGAISYRQRCGFDHSSVAMAVVVQLMVPAERSGVMFTSNPVKPNRREIVINSVHGLAEALVSGEATPDVFTVDKETMDILKRNPASKAMNATPESPHQLKEEFIASLTDPQIHRLVELGMSIEEGFGEPQDIEWAITGNEIHVLQSRPVFTLLSRHDIWRQRSPAQISIEKPVIEKRLKEKRQRVSVDREARYRRSVDLRSDWENEIMPGLVGEINNIKSLDLSSMSDHELASCFKDVVSANREHYRVRIMVGSLIDSSLDKLETYLEESGFLAPEQYPLLLVGLPNKDRESDAALKELATKTSPTIKDVLQKGSTALKDLEKTVEGSRWLKKFKSYLEEFGHMSSAKWDVMAPTYGESLEFLVNTILNYSQQGKQEKSLSLEMEREELVRKVLDSLPAGKRSDFKEALSVAQKNYPLKDDRDFYYLMSLSQVRRAFLEAGLRLQDRGVTDSVEDVFFLKSKEVPELITGKVTNKEEVRAKIRARKLTFNERAQTSNDMAVEAVKQEYLSFEDEATILNGLGISPGVATGRARVVRSLHEFPMLEAGDILVSPAATPAWAPVLSIVSGIVTDVGGVLSHGGILAREYGIPAVSNTGIGTNVIEEGQIITVDGRSGLVRIYRSKKGVEEKG